MKNRLKWTHFAPKYGYFLKVPFFHCMGDVESG
jgi:hypothetical protein